MNDYVFVIGETDNKKKNSIYGKILYNTFSDYNIGYGESNAFNKIENAYFIYK